MKQGNQSWLWLIGLLATGCSGLGAEQALTTPAAGSSFQQQAQADRQQLRHKSALTELNQLVFQPLSGDKSWVQIGADNQVFAFDTGKSYVAAFALPPLAPFTRATIRVPLDFTVFMPSVMLLDEKKRVLQTIPSSTFTYAPGTLLAGQNLEGEFTIPAATGAERAAYMVLFTTDEDLQRTTKLSAEVLQRVMEYDRASDVARFRNSEVPHAATGRLYLTLETPAAAQPMPVEATTNPAAAVAADKPLGEQEYYQRIRTAVANKDYEQALGWVKAAEKAGFTQARSVFFAAQP